MSSSLEGNKAGAERPPFKMIARSIGVQLRDEFERPEAEPLPVDHVDLLLRLRHKERERARRSTPST